jgi:ABC-type nitrate/sulfonate/bicarbonate transport system permease component
LSVTRQPTYPSKDEVAAEVVHQVEQKLVIQTEENRKLMEQITTTLYFVSAGVFIALIVALLTFILAGLTRWRGRSTSG